MTRPAVSLCLWCWSRTPTTTCPHTPDGKHRTRRVYADSVRWDRETRSFEVDGVGVEWRKRT